MKKLLLLLLCGFGIGISAMQEKDKQELKERLIIRMRRAPIEEIKNVAEVYGPIFNVQPNDFIAACGDKKYSPNQLRA